MIHICGDSFATSDLRSTIIPWHEQLDCKSYGKVGASNTMISQQVDTAIQSGADFIIVLFTSSARFEHASGPYSVQNLYTAGLNQTQRRIVKEWAVELFDLDWEIYRNKCIIEGVLARLKNSGISFLFDQGGFEHPKWGIDKKYFTEYDDNRSKYNLWDYGDTQLHIPSFHITDQNIHNEIAEYYHEQTR